MAIIFPTKKKLPYSETKRTTQTIGVSHLKKDLVLQMLLWWKASRMFLEREVL
jgi:hypothetical protein